MQTTDIVPNRGYSFEDAAAALDICTKTLRKRVTERAIRAVQVSQRRKIIPGSEIIRVLSGTVAA